MQILQNKKFKTIFLISMLLIPVIVYAMDNENINICIGHQHLIHLKGIKRVALANPAIANLRVLDSGDELLITGTGNGNTNLTIWLKSNEKKTIEISVWSRQQWEIKHGIERIIGNSGGQIKISRDGEKVSVTGTLNDIRVYRKLMKYISLNQERILCNISITPDLITDAIQELKESLYKINFKNIKLTRMVDTICLEGEVSSDDELKKIDSITSDYPGLIKNFVKIGNSLKKMVEIDVHVLEINRHFLRNIGIDWQDFLELSSSIQVSKPIPRGKLSGSVNISSGISALINFLSQNGQGRILANPRLLCRSGEKADFIAGGQIPVLLVSERSASVEWKEYGIMLHISPQVDENGNIMTDISAEISSLDKSTSLSGIPGIITRRVRTSVNTTNGETVALSGLVSSIEGNDINSIPAIGDLPIIGELFKSRSFQDKKSEMIVFITPRIVEPGTSSQSDDIERIRKKFEEIGLNKGFKILN